jgi:hypothetical protein
MTLFLQNDAGGSGTGGVFADRGFGHLVQIANMDTGIGQHAPVGDLIRITYTETLTGITPDRLDDLVNTDFSGVPGTTDIIVIPVDATFVRPNGHFVTENAGLTFPVGNAENPTSSVLIVYDTSDNNGGGYCLPAEGGGTVGFPGLVILYHELSHALRMATSSQLDNSDTGCTANPEEHQAEIDENDMRDQLGVGHRDTTQHCATTGCTSSCCVVASVATGSPYSADVNQLRRLRDDSLRGSEVGFDFFERLHYDYYAFSPQVVRMMERAPALRASVSATFVVPLTRCLQLLRFSTEQRPDAAALGERFEAGLQACPELVALSSQDVAMALALLRRPDDPEVELPAELAPLAELLRDKASGSPYIRWALLDTIEIYLCAAGRRLEGEPPAQLGRWLSRRLDEWGAALPLTEVWLRLSDYAIGEELGFLRQRLMPAPHARARFAERLSAHLADRAAIDALLERKGYHPERSAA